MNVTEIYPYGRCFLKGFFNAIESFCDGRDIDGWRLAIVMEQARCLDHGISIGTGIIPESAVEYPKYTRITPELKIHVESLLRLFSSLEPLTFYLRPTDVHKLQYFVVDESAKGFGLVIQYSDGSTER